MYAATEANRTKKMYKNKVRHNLSRNAVTYRDDNNNKFKNRRKQKIGSRIPLCDYAAIIVRGLYF